MGRLISPLSSNSFLTRLEKNVEVDQITVLFLFTARVTCGSVLHAVVLSGHAQHWEGSHVLVCKQRVRHVTHSARGIWVKLLSA